MSKLKVIHICDKFGMKGSTIHGVSRLFAWWLPRYNSDRFDVKLYAVKSPEGASRSLEAEGVNMTYLGKSAFDPSTLSAIVKVIKQEQADVVQLHGWIAANFGRVAGRLTGVPTIMHEHGVDPSFPRSQRIADRMLSGCTHTALAVSKSVRDFLISQRSVSADKIKIIYNGAPLSEFSPVSDEEASRVRKELGIPANRQVVGTVGRLDTQKGLTYLLKSVKIILKSAPDTHFVIVGDGPKKEELEREASDLQITGNVTFAGHRSDVQTLQSFFSVQAFPSLWEGTPLTVFEAMAMGLPIVSTDVDGLGEVLENNKSALIVEPKNPEQLAEGILKVLGDHDLSNKLRTGAVVQSRHFDIDQTVRNLESLYEELCAKR